ncbi:cell division cycle-associated protein 2 isoform X2 [Lampris incognitus]|uniref:cell division cycle-associated protein 2 isoform X2 n=1 Tax=Lampris incognitus TaxID=2546036 RepID=UPI0024B605E0|nr:cell division cycle-associated protein 2 isoform X2 [Lampris incognitus]
MASPLPNTASIDGVESMMLPLSECTQLNNVGDVSALDFRKLSPSQFGISAQSFSPSLAKTKDKSRLVQLKERRRSSVGVHGSPETNSLICFMARHRMKTQITPNTPEALRDSPLLPQASPTLKHKMASFWSLMDVEKSDSCDAEPGKNDETSRCIKTDYLSDVKSLDGGKENSPPPVTRRPSKRRCMYLTGDCVGEIREASTSILTHISVMEQQQLKHNSTIQTAKIKQVDEEQVPQVVKLGTKPSTETAHIALCCPNLISEAQTPTSCELQLGSPNKNQQVSFGLQSPSQLQTENRAVGQPAPSLRSFPVPSCLPSLLEMKPTGERNSENSTVKKKRVHFGGPLSPELFDKHLPPSTPLRKGGTPIRAHTPGRDSQLQSLLKTPQRIETQTPIAKFNFSSPVDFGASPPLSIQHNYRVHSVGEDDEEMSEKIPFPSMEEINCLIADATEGIEEIQPLDSNTAFQEESLSGTLTDSVPCFEALPSALYQTDGQEEPESLPKTETEPESKVPARSRSRKRKQPEESKPVLRSKRSAAMSASEMMKPTRVKRQWGAKDVDRSLYGPRAYASKNPNLSPIAERRSSKTRQPLTRRTTGEVLMSDHITGLLGAAALLRSPANIINQKTEHTIPTVPRETPSDAPVTSTAPGKQRAIDKSSRCSRPRQSASFTTESQNSALVRGRVQKGSKVNVYAKDWLSEELQEQQETGVKKAEHSEDQITENLQADLPTVIVLENGGEPRPLVNTSFTDTNKNAEVCTHLGLPTTACPPIEEEITNIGSVTKENLSKHVKSAQSKAKSDRAARGRSRGRRSSANISISKETEVQESQAEEYLMGHKAQKEEPSDPASQLENSHRPSSDGQANIGSLTKENLSKHIKPAQSKAKSDRAARDRSRGRRCSENTSISKEGEAQESQAEEYLMGHKAQKEELSDPASQLGNSHQPSSDGQAKETADQALAPWQAEFNIDDIFKPVATRKQRSVRRSLRNLNNMDQGSDTGLAWLPYISPDGIREICRRTQHRQPRATLLL